MERAREGFEEALKIRRQLAEKNPDAYLPYLAVTLNDLASLDRDQERMETARKELEEALGIFEQFAATNAERFQSDVARVKLLLKDLTK
jgi:tetratricopeptide (TPR) repeat protein